MIDTGVRFDHPDLLRIGRRRPSAAGLRHDRRRRHRERRRRSRRRPVRPRRLGDGCGDLAAERTVLPVRAAGRAQFVARHADERARRRTGQQRHRDGGGGAQRAACCRCACWASAAATTRTSSRACCGPPGLGVPGVPANPTPARVLNLSLGGDGACTSAYVDAIGRINAAGTVVVVAAGNNAGHALGAPAQLPRRDRSDRAAPRRHQGRLLRSRPRCHHQRAGRQLREHRAGLAVPLSDPHDFQCRHHDTGRRRVGRVDLHRQLQRIAWHQLLGAARRRRRRR